MQPGMLQLSIILFAASGKPRQADVVCYILKLNTFQSLKALDFNDLGVSVKSSKVPAGRD